MFSVSPGVDEPEKEIDRCAVPVPHRFHSLLWITQIFSDGTDEVDYTDSFLGVID